MEFFVDAPFALTADRRSAKSWSGRPEILTKLERIVFSYGTRPDSSIALMWANLGAGKTHALLHLWHLLQTPSCVPVYVEMPQQPKKFVEIYQRIVVEIPAEKLVSSRLSTPIAADFNRAVRIFQYGGASERFLVQEWLAGGKVPLKELRAASGIGSRIEEDAQACEMLCTIVSAMSTANRRLVVLWDEFQRIGSATQKQRETLLGHLRTVFSRNPSHFSLVVAVGSRIEKTALDLLPRELRSLMSAQAFTTLPEMNRQEALDFVMGRLTAFRPLGYQGDPVAPFGLRALEAAVDFVDGHDRARLIPRTLLQTLAYLYDESCSIAPSVITPARVKSLLKELHWDD